LDFFLDRSVDWIDRGNIHVGKTKGHVLQIEEESRQKPL
jgi:hypothetical protein